MLPDRLLEKGLLVAREGSIVFAGAQNLSDYLASNPRFRGLPVMDCGGCIIAPRLVEMHLHGAFGIGFENLRGGDDLLYMFEEFRKRGIGCFVPTILWDEKAVGRLVDAIEEARLPKTVLPGIYIEGPFVNPKKRGGINPGQIAAPDADLCKKIIDTARGMLKIMTVAPELPGIGAIYPILRQAGVLVSLGHSEAGAGIGAEIGSLPPSPFSITHLFNAMSGVDHRGDGGLANLALTGEPRWVELNADGIHVNASSMKIASLCIPGERLILTSDAVVSAGLAHGAYSYFGKEVVSDEKGVRYRDSHTLIGSNRLGMEIVLSFMRASGRPLHAAVASMSLVPSAALGLPDGCQLEGGPRLPDGGHAAAFGTGAASDVFIWNKELSSCRCPADAVVSDELPPGCPDGRPNAQSSFFFEREGA